MMQHMDFVVSTARLAQPSSPASRSVTLYQRLFKRPVDLILVTASLPLTLPLLCVLGGLVALSGPGPIFLRVTRKGKGDSAFRQFRFRCVHLDAALRQYRDGTPSYEFDDDPRLTGIGRFLLRTGLNALPQMLNVLMGHMSLVGPKPMLLRATHKAPTLGAPTDLAAPGVICPSNLPVYADLNEAERHGIALAYSQRITATMDLRVALHALWQVLPRSGK